MKTSYEVTVLLRLSEMVSFAEYLPLDLITQRNPEPTYPVTIGELLANYTISIILQHKWESEENERIAEPLFDALNQLDTGVDRPAVWKELFEANKKLQEYLERKN